MVNLLQDLWTFATSSVSAFLLVTAFGGSILLGIGKLIVGFLHELINGFDI